MKGINVAYVFSYVVCVFSQTGTITQGVWSSFEFEGDFIVQFSPQGIHIILFTNDAIEILIV